MRSPRALTSPLRIILCLFYVEESQPQCQVDGTTLGCSILRRSPLLQLAKKRKRTRTFRCHRRKKINQLRLLLLAKQKVRIVGRSVSRTSFKKHPLFIYMTTTVIIQVETIPPRHSMIRVRVVVAEDGGCGGRRGREGGEMMIGVKSVAV